jgi:hypothetical protein
MDKVRLSWDGMIARLELVPACQHLWGAMGRLCPFDSDLGKHVMVKKLIPEPNWQSQLSTERPKGKPEPLF